jgi:hypothetical protein
MDFRVLSANKGVVAGHAAAKTVDDALKKAGSKPCRDIVDYLGSGRIQFDIFILPSHIMNGSMNSVTDDGGDTGNDAKRCYTGAGLVWLERPTVFWNPSCSVKIYSDVSGVVDVGQVGFRRMTPKEAPRGTGERTLVYRKPARAKGLSPIDKVVILGAEVVLDPWIVLMHELGHMKQYFTVARSLRQPAHDPQVETAWGVKAFGVNSCEPENLELHENPITKFHCASQYRRRYYHDGFHFGSTTGYDGWVGGPLNNDFDLTKPQDNFIFTNQAQRAMFAKKMESLPTAPPAAAGYYCIA